ncbi:MAG TPA: SLBB domain-containing protein [Terracidiphilus sp.]
MNQVSDPRAAEGLQAQAAGRLSYLSLNTSARALVEHWRVFLGVLGGVLLACVLYCLVAPRQYEARARVAWRAAEISSLNLEAPEGARAVSLAAGEAQVETLANVLRSDQLAWRVILAKRLYQSPGFANGMPPRDAGFRPEAPNPAAQAYLLERFQKSLSIRTVPRTVLIELRFRSRDPGLSAAVLNELVRAFQDQEAETRILATAQATGWLSGQLAELKTKADGEQEQLAVFQTQHGLLITPETQNGQSGVGEHLTALLQADEVSRELVAASSERMMREAEFRAASEGDPELVLGSSPRLQTESGGLSMAVIRQIHQRRSELEQERAQLSAEHGPNFPRVVEIRQLLEDLARQQKAEDAKLLERFRSAFQTAADREQMVRKRLMELTGEGQQMSAAAAQYEGMRREAQASRELYVRMLGKVEEAGLAAGVHTPDLWLVDPAHTPARPTAPNVPLFLAIALFAGVWMAAVAVYLVRILRPVRVRGAATVLLLVTMAVALNAQAPTPNTSGLPTGVVKIPPAKDTKNYPNPKEAPPVWNAPAETALAGAVPMAPMAGPIVAGEILDVAEYHTQEFRSSVRVSEAGTVMLPMVGAVKVAGLDESAAALAIAHALVAQGMLLHPQVTVMVTAYVGQDVTVLGEVGRPGVYPYGPHHRLLDLISAASGINVTAGGLVDITHRDRPGDPQMLTLDFNQPGNEQQNPELWPGDLVHVSRAGLVYVVGDVNRPGGFTLDPAQHTTVLQALSLAWGPSQNANLGKAVLIHARDDGRTVTTLNLKRMLRGEDPDLPVGERDILFVPDSMARNLWNRTLESAVQSAAGVSIYAGMVYSQRF